MENSFSVGTLDCKVSKINAFKQFHIVRRIAPILSDLIPVAQKLSKLSPDKMQDEENLAALSPILNGISKLSDEDADKVLMGLLEAVEINRNGAWGCVVRNGQLMFADLELSTMMQLAGRAFMYNMAGFFSVLQQSS